MEIAGIDFALACENPVIFRDPGPAYWPLFEKTNGSLGSFALDVRLEVGNMPAIENWTLIFDAGRTWRMFRCNDDYCFAYVSLDQEQLGWLAWFKRDFTTPITICCGDGLISDQDGVEIIFNPLHYHQSQILLMYVLATRGEGVIFHAAGASMRGKGLLFPGQSGAGKSTLSRQLLLGKNMEMLSDERMVVRKINDAFYAFGTPWPGDAGIAVNKGDPLHALFFIHHGDANKIVEISPRQAFERLMPVTSIPWYDREVVPSILDFCEDLTAHIPAYELHFRPTPEVAGFLEDFIGA